MEVVKRSEEETMMEQVKRKLMEGAKRKKKPSDGWTDIMISTQPSVICLTTHHYHNRHNDHIT